MMGWDYGTDMIWVLFVFLFEWRKKSSYIAFYIYFEFSFLDNFVTPGTATKIIPIFHVTPCWKISSLTTLSPCWSVKALLVD
jgi:hypothetical protein